MSVVTCHCGRCCVCLDGMYQKWNVPEVPCIQCIFLQSLFEANSSWEKSSESVLKCFVYTLSTGLLNADAPPITVWGPLAVNQLWLCFVYQFVMSLSVSLSVCSHTFLLLFIDYPVPFCTCILCEKSPPNILCLVWSDVLCVPIIVVYPCSGCIIWRPFQSSLTEVCNEFVM